MSWPAQGHEGHSVQLQGQAQDLQLSSQQHSISASLHLVALASVLLSAES